MSRLGYRLLEGLALVAALVGFVAASAAEVTVASVLIAGVCAGVVFGVLRFGPPEPRDFDLFGEPFDPELEEVSKPKLATEGRFGR